LPNYKEIVHRGVALTKSKIEYYKIAKIRDENITESAFVSSSKSLSIANQYSKASAIISIVSKTGKEIEKYSCYGLDHPQNEKEVLFKSKTMFSVLEVDDSEDIIKIILEEIENG